MKNLLSFLFPATSEKQEDQQPTPTSGRNYVSKKNRRGNMNYRWNKRFGTKPKGRGAG